MLAIECSHDLAGNSHLSSLGDCSADVDPSPPRSLSLAVPLMTVFAERAAAKI
jgi:hypothetical protein